MNNVPRSVQRCFASIALAAAVVSGSIGCFYRTPSVRVPAAFPAIAAASFRIAPIDVVGRSAVIDPVVARELRVRATSMLHDAVLTHGLAGSRAQIHVSIVLGPGQQNVYGRALRQDGMAVFAMVGVPFGQVLDQQKLEVDVKLEIAGHTFVGRGIASELGSLIAPARRRALGIALNRALIDAARHS